MPASRLSKRRPAKRSIGSAISLARLFVLLAVSAPLLAACQEKEAPAEKMPLVVKGMTVQLSENTRSVTLSGEIRARVQSDLSFRGSGQIAERFADVGDHVEAGQVLATLETQEQAADVESARATLRSAEATLRQAQTNLERQKVLIDGGFTTKSNYDSADEAMKTASGSLDAAKADVGTAEDQLAYTTLKAEAPGIITARNVDVGQVVSPAQAVFTLARDGARDAVFDIYEGLLEQEPEDNSIEVTLLSDPSVKVIGHVREIAPTFDSTTGTVRVKVELPDRTPPLPLGAAVAGTGRTKGQSVASLPWMALASKAGKPAVWVVDPKSSAATLRDVTIDRYRQGEVLVADGLKTGEVVVTAGAQFLHAGQAVRIETGDAP